ncbi:hypothetical protein [bacterium endosymbiont of Bathymodiolus sp. 5 South]|uniref:hypothetical protein n=1 Tax=bacterium endosymbiont of Bathymodiolus sp. 5 South TaxID=1181670 RepID=UPI0010BADF02|nr:hypothetical protein [bacterium endosymbiont of Bathymodiolus sp. 5 South]CAC9652673.1 hypothetical protein [uncultured Gammaproteobacteria bacterium]CAC9657125.1 hypothetical protein [uncultured Gammaproteobacteria bacterium]SHN92371.1 hypothetical protein BCLUESOX_2491 [bacterium endosymbiont of Bathymodiolus sp. 5 South]VVH57868.1 hypothetical protein BSPCLSOX_545 [uncultured Gammaproteobacteria bacterium]VVH62127.1 hypothetical protein BSPWISOX_1830 [uncultured Gammaproteobacteria bacte
MEFLDTIKANSASTESTVLGYKVKASYVTSSEIETKIREESLARVSCVGWLMRYVGNFKQNDIIYKYE